MSLPCGDIHDEQEGSAPGRAGESGLGGEDQQPGGAPAPCGSVRGNSNGSRCGSVRTGHAAWRIGVAGGCRDATLAPELRKQVVRLMNDPVRGLQRCAPDREAAGAARAADQSGERAAPAAGPGPPGPPSPSRSAASELARAGAGAGPVGATRCEPLCLVRGAGAPGRVARSDRRRHLDPVGLVISPERGPARLTVELTAPVSWTLLWLGGKERPRC
jgi:hypothetical protein